MEKLLARKVSPGKWRDTGGLGDGAIQADAVTADLRTQNNELSFWKVTSDADAELHEAVLALATAGDRLDKIDIAWVKRDTVEEAELTILESPDSAATPVESLKVRHVDVAKLDHVRLGKVALLIHRAVHANNVRRFMRAKVLDVVVAAVRGRRVAVEDLQEGELRDEVQKKLTLAP